VRYSFLGFKVSFACLLAKQALENDEGGFDGLRSRVVKNMNKAVSRKQNTYSVARASCLRHHNASETLIFHWEGSMKFSPFKFDYFLLLR